MKNTEFLAPDAPTPDIVAATLRAMLEVVRLECSIREKHGPYSVVLP
jgi:hypothetical protein